MVIQARWVYQAAGSVILGACSSSTVGCCLALTLTGCTRTTGARPRRARSKATRALSTRSTPARPCTCTCTGTSNPQNLPGLLPGTYHSPVPRVRKPYTGVPASWRPPYARAPATMAVTSNGHGIDDVAQVLGGVSAWVGWVERGPFGQAGCVHRRRSGGTLGQVNAPCPMSPAAGSAEALSALWPAACSAGLPLLHAQLCSPRRL